MKKILILSGLILGGAPIYGMSKTREEKLRDVAADGNLVRVKTLLKSNPDLHKSDMVGNTALHNAAFQGHIEVVECLLDYA